MKGTVPAKSIEPVLPFDLKLEGIRAGGLTRALHRQLSAAIRERRLPAGYALPSTRHLAGKLGVGRNTVIAAYDLLIASGYAKARRGARLVVVAPHADELHVTGAKRTRAVSKRNLKQHIAAAWRQPADRIVYPQPLPARSFRTGVPESRYFDHDVWRRLTSRASRSIARMPFTYGPVQGLPELREAIAGHVAFVRAVACEANDLIITSGAQQAFDLLARLLVTPGETRVAVENPAYPPMRAAFKAAGAQLVPVPVDDEGLRVERLPRDVQVVCVTPSHQSPTGAVMSASRRAALLTWARSADAVVIEDDYDGEFLYDAHTQDALQTLDRDGRVFYVGTFSKSLFPGLRKGFVVVPEWARDALLNIKRCADSHTDVVIQTVLAAFISEGHLARHIRRMRRVYAERRQTLEQGAREHWSDFMRVIPGNAGLQLSTRFVDDRMADVIAKCAAQHLPGTLPLSAYSLGPLRQPGLCIGYGAVEVDQIATAVRALSAALRGAARSRSLQRAW